MNLERGIERHRIGGWEFLPATGELRRRTELRRLEPRAAKALLLLCEANGELVSQEQLIAEVWHGRALSENSIAVVIGQLRRALDDDAREPRLIETIPKRGYRLHRQATTPATPLTHRRGLMAVTAVALIALLAALILLPRAASSRGTLAVADVANATGNAAYAPVARATSELIVTELGKQGFSLRRTGQGDLLLTPKLVMWDGLPYLAMSATDPQGVVRWSSMSKATPGAIPPAVHTKLGELAARFPPDELRGRVADGQRRR
jgi:DNA-binding winged helix-turn-helix (wHTH) protein